MVDWTIADYRAQYAHADELCQEVQHFRNKAGIPAMNELRNAGHHFLKSLGDDGGVKDQAELASAIGHVRKACYEATEAGILFAVNIAKKFQGDYSGIEVSGIIPDYVVRLKSCNQALRLLETGRQNGFDRTKDHADRIAVFRELRDFADNLHVGREEANKKVAADRKLTRRFIIQITLAVLAILITLSGIFWASIHYTHFWETPASKAS